MSIGRVLNAAFGTILSNLFVMMGIALLFVGVPRVMISYLEQPFLHVAATGATGAIEHFGFTFGTTVLNMVFMTIAQGALFPAIAAASRGDRASFGDSLSAAFGRLLPLIGLGVVSGLAICFAALLLVVPGIILAVMWYVAAPIVVAERESVFGALGRSVELTEGERWNIFVVLLVVFSVWLATVMLSVTIAGAMATAGMLAGGSGLMPLLIMVAGVIGAAIGATIAGALPSAVYVELRRFREGPESHGLVDIFA